MSTLKLVTFSLCCLLSCATCAQAQTDGYRPKIAEFSYQVLGHYQTISNSETFGNASSQIERDLLLKIKLGIPLIIKNKTVFGVQLKYYHHHFGFDEDDFMGGYDLYDHINGRSFTDLGARIAYQRKLENGSELSFIAGAEIRSDKIVWSPNTSKYFISGQYKKQVNERTKIGFGAVFNYGLRLTSFYPLFTYEKTLNSKWTVDLTLPKSAAIRHKLDAKTFLIAEVDFVGWRYNLTRPISGDLRDFTLRKADLEFQVKFEREIHDWLWFGAEVGYSKNVSYYLANPGERGNKALIDLRAKDASSFKFSIFIVPPKSFSK